MPVLILVLKMGIIMSFITTTQVSFTDDRIFPSTKRNTSVGTCGMIARSVTIVAPIVNEWPAPFPIIALLIFSVIGILTSLTFPGEDEFTLGQKIKDTKYSLEDKTSSDISYHSLSGEDKFENSSHGGEDILATDATRANKQF